MKTYLVIVKKSFVARKAVKARKWNAKNGWRFDEFLHTLTLSENPGKVLGESRARRKILGVICREFWENQGFLHHQTASFAGAPITTREEARSLSRDSAACEG